jgi:tellurite resistance-related uncharacterized protein
VLEDLAVPPDVALVRTTPAFDAATVPAGLLGAHRLAPGVWGRLRVSEGSVTFVLEETGERRHLVAGDAQVIEPDTPHHVEVGPGGVFAVELLR